MWHSARRLRKAALALWSRTTMNPYVSTGPIAHLFTRLLAPLTQSPAPPCLFRSLTHSQACRLVDDLMLGRQAVLNHSVT